MNLRIRRSVSPLMLLLALAAPLAIADSARAQGAPTPHIGVVNLGKVFNSMQETKDIKAGLESDQNNLQTVNQQHQQELNNMQQDIRNGPKPGSQQYDDLVERYDEKTAEYQTWLKLEQLKIARKQTHQLKMIFDKIQSTVTDLAKKKNLELVVTEVAPELPPEGGELTPDALSNLINQRNVMYVNPDIDMTAEVVTALDANYKAGVK